MKLTRLDGTVINMKLGKIKEEIRVIGIDDAPFTPHTEGEVLLFGDEILDFYKQ